MTHKDWIDIGAAIMAFSSLAIGVWNRFGIKALDIRFNGLNVKYVAAEKHVSYDDGVRDEKERQH